MGSPEKPNKSTTPIIGSTSTTSPQSTAFQDSPIFNYINNLSPIKPVKGTSVMQQVFPGLNSPPLVFTSPQINKHRQSIDLTSSNSQLSCQDDIGSTASGVNLTPSENSCLENSEKALLKTTDSIEVLLEQDNEGNLQLGEKDGQTSSCAKSNIVQNQASNVTGDQLVSEVGQSQLGKRRRLEFEAPQGKNAEKLSCNIKKSSVTVSKPSGIGLHLNSIVNAMPLSYPCGGGGKKSISISSSMQDNTKKYSSISSNSNLLENDSSKSEDNAREIYNSKANSMKMIEYEDKFDKVNLNYEQAERVDELERSKPKKKRKKTESSDDGCKRCNCKKTKCLKLYCDCFAAGIYCADSCACQGCFNRPEYEETVLETRQQIESRNPSAFAPKIVHRPPTQSPQIQMEDGDQLTSIAGRHKRGCNCKKSMCLKKYCECYQANVGCSDGCRCEGCKNIYGTKGVSGIIGETGMEAIKVNLHDSFDDKLKVGSHKPHKLTPQTPSFQNSNHGKDVSKARVPPGKYVLSPESECTFDPNPYISTPRSPNDSDMITEASNKNLEMGPFDQESYPNIEFTDEFSPGDWSNNNNSSRPQVLPPPSNVSLCFRGSPVTLFSGTKPSFEDLIDENISTPRILKTSPNKKRVSPPRIRLHELGSTSLKSGRKFILKAVPSFPPLTPCIDSKDTTGGQTSNHPSGNNNL